MNRLFYNRCYLSGPIDYAEDFGVGWRRMAQQKLKDLNLIFLDPCNKPMMEECAVEDLENHKHRRRLKEQGAFDEVSRMMRTIRRIDLRMADMCDFAIVHLDLDVYSTGTHEEIVTMNRRKVPILTHVEQGKAALPDWYLGTLPHEMIFSTWEELFQYIRHVAYANPPIDTFKRWQFFDYGRLYNMDTIPLTRDKVAKISPEDHRYLMQWKWHTVKKGRKSPVFYAECDSKVKMQCEVIRHMGICLPLNYTVDHINQDRLDNRRKNLRIVEMQQNTRHGVKGVCYDTSSGMFKAAVWKEDKIFWQKHFKTLKASLRAIQKKQL